MGKDNWHKLVYNSSLYSPISLSECLNCFNDIKNDPLQTVPTPIFPEENPQTRFKQAFIEIATNHKTSEVSVIIAVTHSDGYKTFRQIAEPHYDRDHKPPYCATSVIKFEISSGISIPKSIEHLIL